MPGTDGDSGHPIFVLFYVYDGILVDVGSFAMGAGYDGPSETLASDHFPLLGPRRQVHTTLLGAYDLRDEYMVEGTSKGIRYRRTNHFSTVPQKL